MKYLLITLIFFTPLAIAHAHALPLAYVPVEFSLNATMPQEVSIRFTEDILPTSNGIEVFTSGGTKLSAEEVFLVPGDARTMKRQITPAGEGIYVISWHGVSAVDGHYTRGAFSFFAGATSSALEIYGGSAKEEKSFFKKIRDTAMRPFASLRGPLWSISRTDASRRITVTDLGGALDVMRFVLYDKAGKQIGTSSTTAPMIVLHNAEEGVGPLVVPAKSRGGGVYDIPWALLTPAGKWHVAVTWSIIGEYDVSTTFGVDYPSEIFALRTEAEKGLFATLLSWVKKTSSPNKGDEAE